MNSAIGDSPTENIECLTIGIGSHDTSIVVYVAIYAEGIKTNRQLVVGRVVP